jgi:hypothetical protein
MEKGEKSIEIAFALRQPRERNTRYFGRFRRHVEQKAALTSFAEGAQRSQSFSFFVYFLL